jgi:glycosyltransferase involved in cell wall biosynthesis
VPNRRTPPPATAAASLDIGVYGARGVPSTYSGYETFLTQLLPALVERGDRVTAYCRAGEGFDATVWRGVERRVLPAVTGKNSSTLTHGVVAAVAARAARHDVVLVVNVANAAYCGLARWTGQPVVLNVDGQEWLRGKWGRTARTVFRGSARIARHCATALVADGAAMADVYRDEFRSPSTVIPYCITTAGWQPGTAAVTEAGLEPGRYLLVAGRLNPENNIDRIAAAYAASDLPLPLVVLGAANYDSPVADVLGRLAASDARIRVLGHVGSRQAFFDLVHHATAYLHGHSVGGTNPSLVEAMAVGARIAANDTPFSRETLGGQGVLFRLGADAGAAGLVPVLRQVLAADPAEDARVRRATRHRAEHHFSEDAVVDAYRAVLAAAAAVRWPRTVVVPTMWSAPEPAASELVA